VHWLLGSFSLSSHNTIGHIRISKSGSSVYWKYSENERKWTEKKGIILSNLEKKIILLSAQGVQEQEIAKMLHISTPLLKFRKRELFIRLKVNNISKTILRAINYHLL
jgi:transcriptional regulator, luxR family